MLVPLGRDRWDEGPGGAQGQSQAVGHWLGPGMSQGLRNDPLHYFKHGIYKEAGSLMREVWEPHRRHGCGPDVSMQEAAASRAGGAQEEGCPGLLGPQGSCRPLQSRPAAAHTQTFLQGPCPTSACSRTGLLLSSPLRAGVSHQRALQAHGGCGKNWGAGVGCGRRETCPPEPRAQPPDAEGTCAAGGKHETWSPMGRGGFGGAAPWGGKGSAVRKLLAGVRGRVFSPPLSRMTASALSVVPTVGPATAGLSYPPHEAWAGQTTLRTGRAGWGCSAGWRGMPTNEAGFPSRGRLGKADPSLTV